MTSRPVFRFASPVCFLLGLCLPLSGVTAEQRPGESGLLFHLSGDRGTTADFAASGQVMPNFLKDVNPVADGARGAALRCEHTQRLAYWAPGNIYAQRGTLAFFWRAREAVGPTEFPIFRVSYGDHSSWDMVWLRIDYNGHGFDAFVTDINLARTRVSMELQPFPPPQEWIHLALTWDETSGIRFYVNGKLAGEQAASARYDAALDQFGPHSRIISPYQVQSDYNFVRGGDLDELRIYDRPLAATDIATLAKGGGLPQLTALPMRALADAGTRDEWSFRYGWNRADDLPPALAAGTTSVRKVEIHDVFDLKRWWWKGTDGIRETTWPGVYNQSRLPGRNDYFKLPDWDCYSLSGQSVTFTLPEEPWNHLEISGAAWGKGFLVAENARELFVRARAQEKTVHRFTQTMTGQKIRFDNVEQEQPIGEFAAYNVTSGREPAGAPALAYRVSAPAATQPGIAPLSEFVRGRHPADEQAILVAEPANAPVKPGATPALAGLPLLHVFIPAKAEATGYTLDKIDGALDGIALDLPTWKSAGALAFNVRVKDPLWPARDLADFTFTANPRDAHTLWLDLRDRILPEGRGLYLTIAAADLSGNVAALAPSQIRLVFKPRAAGLAEHERDRFTQVRDNYAMLVEENPRERGYRLWARFEDDLNDLLRVNPKHPRGLEYKADAMPGSVRPEFAHSEPPAGVPLWAFRQVETLRRAAKIVLWYIDHRQIDNGELGGGLSDDTDMTNYWPGLALMGVEPEKISESVRRVLDACYAQGMVTNGLPTIQTDELHTYEEGINALGENLILDYGSPRQLERAMETTRGLAGITGVNAAGHRHIRSSYYSGSRMAVEGVWGWSKAYSHLVFQPVLQLADYNGNPAAKKLLVELTDGLLAHRKPDKDGKHTLPTAIHFESDVEGTASRGYFPWPFFWNAWQWTGDRKYLDPIFDLGSSTLSALNPNALDLLGLRETWGRKITEGDFATRDLSRPGITTQQGFHFAWQVSGDKKFLETLYANLTERMALREYINTEGSLWIDRINFSTSELQRARLGGVALARNAIFPGHVVSWNFHAPATAESVAILIPSSNPGEFKVLAHNLETADVAATMTGWNINPGQWEITQGLDKNNDDQADAGSTQTHTVELERTRSTKFTFPPKTTTVLTFKNVQLGTPYSRRPDLGIDREDVTTREGSLSVKVHSLGSVPVPASAVALVNPAGKTLVRGATPELPAPLDWFPKTAEVTLAVPVGVETKGCRVVLDPEQTLTEITTRNNEVTL